MRLESGDLPSGLVLPTGPVQASDAGRLQFWWQDGNTDDQEPVDFSVLISAVDAAGNESEAVSVAVRDEGSGGCRVGGTTVSGWLVALTLSFGLLCARRWRPVRYAG